MKRTTHGLLLLSAGILTLGAATSAAVEPKTPITIFGISRLVVGIDSIRLTKNDALPAGLDLIPGGAWSADGVDQLTVKVGESFSVTDRHHVGADYKLLQIANGAALFEALQWTSLDGKEHSSTHKMLVRAYGVEVAGK